MWQTEWYEEVLFSRMDKDKFDLFAKVCGLERGEWTARLTGLAQE
jgi:hypothetical protein